MDAQDLAWPNGTVRTILDPAIEVRFERLSSVPAKGVYVWTVDLWWRQAAPMRRYFAASELRLLPHAHPVRFGRRLWWQFYDVPGHDAAPQPLSAGGLEEAHWHVVARVQSGVWDDLIAGGAPP